MWKGAPPREGGAVALSRGRAAAAAAAATAVAAEPFKICNIRTCARGLELLKVLMLHHAL